MKLFEAIYDENGFRVRRESEEGLSAQQKYNLLITVVICTTICAVVLGFFSLLR